MYKIFILTSYVRIFQDWNSPFVLSLDISLYEIKRFYVPNCSKSFSPSILILFDKLMRKWSLNFLSWFSYFEKLSFRGRSVARSSGLKDNRMVGRY